MRSEATLPFLGLSCSILQGFGKGIYKTEKVQMDKIISEGTLSHQDFVISSFMRQLITQVTLISHISSCVKMQASDTSICIAIPWYFSVIWRYLPVQSCFLLSLIKAH